MDIGILIGISSCNHSHQLTVAIEIEEPRNEIIEKLMSLLENSTEEKIKVEITDSKNSAIDSFIAGKVDLLFTSIM